MKINFVTLFPSFFDSILNESITKRAINSNKVEINIIDFRNYTNDKHKKVDDIIYGGGHGMLLKVEPIDRAIENLKGKKYLMSPQGTRFTQYKAKEMSLEKEITLICGHYEGFDDRVRNLVDEELSIGDYVLTGGEIPAMAIADSIIRLLPDVIKEISYINDSFQKNMLDYPQYTRPRVYKGMNVPEVLFSGNHKLIEQWRKSNALKRTKNRRPDLLKGVKNEK
ncbi:MAG: tRNA (guanosine(37)-N1)-methyltransferase TrmD [Mollicutes bacterium PWAP]|nr:tRNA (guanosine(37)-N1)-methyltransferase TrmD [Mollicutes bacterium PWAP]